MLLIARKIKKIWRSEFLTLDFSFFIYFEITLQKQQFEERKKIMTMRLKAKESRGKRQRSKKDKENLNWWIFDEKEKLYFFFIDFEITLKEI